MHEPKSILIVGGSDTGKTTYAAQLLGRLRQRESTLKFWKTPDKITPVEKALERLNDGLAVEHTPVDVYNELFLPIELESGIRTELAWPDYGGERIERMLERRMPSEELRRRTEDAEGWLLFVRLGHIQDRRDIISRPMEEMVKKGAAKGVEEVTWYDQARQLELLQLLLFVKGIDSTKQAQLPALAVILSCWDELGVATDVRPEEVLREKLPLFAQFISARWRPGRALVMGLSQTERPLDPRNPDVEFIDRGPETFGFVITQDGARVPDLTLPVLELIQRFL